jgi:hypothetical protein
MLLYVAIVAAATAPITLSAQSLWNIFSNRSGWSVNYPKDWTIASCQSCPDPTAPKVFVNFYPPKNVEGGSVTVESLGDRPSNMAVDEWLNELKKTANQNPQLKEERFTLNGLPALRVRYRNRSVGGTEIETVYVVARSKAFSIDFSAGGAGVALEESGTYSIYLKMVKTFKVKS